MTLEEILEKLHSPTEHAITLENGELTALLEELKELREENESLSAQVCDLQLAYNNELADGKKAKRLLKLAVEDFAKLDRVNTKVRNCMITDMDCADCPLNWDSVDDSVEPCHNWRYTDETLKLIGGN